MLRSASLLLLCSTLSSTATADILFLEADRDTTLIQSTSGDRGNGAGIHFFVGDTENNGIRRGLLHFDIAGNIPANSRIVFVRLRVSVTKTIAPFPDNVFLHRVLDDWGEGDSSGAGGGAVATMDDATWRHRFVPDEFWANLGGDFDPTPSAVRVMDNTLQDYLFRTDAMLAEVQSWLDAPATNFGWLMKVENESGPRSARRFGSRENADAALRPLLEVHFVDDAVGTTFCTSLPNSSGQVATMSANGTTDATPLDLTFQIDNLPSSTLGQIFFGPNQLAGLPFGDGLKCVGGMLSRVQPPSGGMGSATIVLNPGAPYTGAIVPGASLNFQFWFRDGMAMMTGVNASDALNITFQ